MGGNPSGTESAAAAQAQQSANKISAQMGPLITALTSGIPGNLNSSVFNYLLNPQSTNLAQAYPGLQSLLSQAGGFYNQEMTQGLSPAYINNALGNYQTQAQQGINSTVNQLGSALPNLAGSVKDMNLNSDMGRANLLSSLGAQNQSVMGQGAAGLEGVSQAGAGLAGGLDAQTLQMLTSALSGSQGAQNSGLSSLNSLFGVYNQSAQYDTSMAAQLQQQQANMWASLLNGAMGLGETAATKGFKFPKW